jgi:hypothetical protein
MAPWSEKVAQTLSFSVQRTVCAAPLKALTPLRGSLVGAQTARVHGLDTAAQFGMAAEEFPCAVLETAPGDIIFMHNSLYHTVLGEDSPG